MRSAGSVAILVAALAVPLGAQTSAPPTQTPPPVQTPAPKPAPPARTPPRPAARTAARPAQIIVRDISGTPIEGTTVTVTGGGTQPLTTDASGSVTVPLAAGTYRLRFEHDGFVTLDRDISVRSGQPTEIDVVLDHAPAPPAPERPPVAAAPPPQNPPAPPAAPPASSAPPVTLSIPAFLDKNYIGRDPLKESVLGCTASGTTRLLQVRDPLAPHVHADMDEVLYVVAGDGEIRIGDDKTMLGPGSLTIVPRGTRHSLDRRGKNPLIVLSTLSGAPCKAGQESATRAR